MKPGTVPFFRSFVVLVCLTICLNAHAQTKRESTCYYTREQALIDISKNTAKILIQGGFAPVIYPTDKDFFSKYKVAYYMFGCVAPEKIECLRAYNQAIFEHLNKSFGPKWQAEIRKDAIGFSKD
jgi:hypothetical protein